MIGNIVISPFQPFLCKNPWATLVASTIVRTETILARMIVNTLSHILIVCAIAGRADGASWQLPSPYAPPSSKYQRETCRVCRCQKVDIRHKRRGAAFVSCCPESSSPRSQRSKENLQLQSAVLCVVFGTWDKRATMP